MKRIFTWLALCLVGSTAFAQQDAQFTQNMFNRMAVNPAYAGSSNAICATLLGRNQWLGWGIQNGGNLPKTYLLSVDAPVTALHGGVGLNVVQDILGFDKTIIANLNYAFRMPLGPGSIAVGLSGGIMNKSISGNWVSIDDHVTDVAIPNGRVSDLKFDVGGGIYYNISDQLYFGVSSTHLPQSSLSAEDLEFRLKRHYYVMAGYNYALPGNPKIELRPSVFVKTEAATSQVDLNMNVMFNKTFWAGASYRTADAVALLLGYQREVGKGNVKIGYAYDLGTSKLKRSGTHELLLGYCFKLSDGPKIEKHHNVRFL